MGTIAVRITHVIEREIEIDVEDAVQETTLTAEQVVKAIEDGDGDEFDALMDYVLAIPTSDWTTVDDTEITVDDAYLSE
jgi:hypothetical protein